MTTKIRDYGFVPQMPRDVDDLITTLQRGNEHETGGLGEPPVNSDARFYDYNRFLKQSRLGTLSPAAGALVDQRITEMQANLEYTEEDLQNAPPSKSALRPLAYSLRENLVDECIHVKHPDPVFADEQGRPLGNATSDEDVSDDAKFSEDSDVPTAGDESGSASESASGSASEGDGGEKDVEEDGEEEEEAVNNDEEGEGEDQDQYDEEDGPYEDGVDEDPNGDASDRERRDYLNPTDGAHEHPVDPVVRRAEQALERAKSRKLKAERDLRDFYLLVDRTAVDDASTSDVPTDEEREKDNYSDDEEGDEQRPLSAHLRPENRNHDKSETELSESEEEGRDDDNFLVTRVLDQLPAEAEPETDVDVAADAGEKEEEAGAAKESKEKK